MAFWNRPCRRPTPPQQPLFRNARESFTAGDIAATALTRDLDVIPILPEVPNQIARCNAVAVKVLLAKIAEVSRVRH